ncbi:MAG: hypothetical protein QOE70_5822 [Chthoniobacter sp.]|jgi:hypothetical protein|nr:hypothetical protein [Chthoniobacter sp.]
MLYVAAAFYAVLFWCVVLPRPGVALALVFALAPFQIDLSGGGPVKFSIAEINLLLTLPVLFLRAPRLVIGPVVLPVLLYFSVCAVSAAMHWRETTLVCMVQMALYLLGAVAVFASLPRAAADLKLALHGFIGIGVFLALVMMVMRSNYVFGLHKNGVGASLSCALLVALELWFAADSGQRRRLLAGALAVISTGLLMSLSRGAWLSALFGVAVLLTMRRQFALFLRAVLVLLPVIAIAWNFLPQESRENATGFDSCRRNISARYESVEIARGYFDADPLLGSGVGLRKEYDATSLVWLTLAETGVLGAGALLLIHVAFLRMVWRAQKIVAREDELFTLLALGAALVVSRLAHGLVDHYWSRGAIMIAWAAAGMATFAFWEVRRRLAEGEYEDENEEEPALEAS